jgi:DNA invertase Pin-like site-specific DNA recombinase
MLRKIKGNGLMENKISITDQIDILVNKCFEKAGSIRNLAKALHVSDTTVRKWLNRRLPSRDNLERLQYYLKEL